MYDYFELTIGHIFRNACSTMNWASVPLYLFSERTDGGVIKMIKGGGVLDTGVYYEIETDWAIGQFRVVTDLTMTHELCRASSITRLTNTGYTRRITEAAMYPASISLHILILIWGFSTFIGRWCLYWYRFAWLNTCNRRCNEPFYE